MVASVRAAMDVHLLAQTTLILLQHPISVNTRAEEQDFPSFLISLAPGSNKEYRSAIDAYYSL
jgi:hypothetical protein